MDSFKSYVKSLAAHPQFTEEESKQLLEGVTTLRQRLIDGNLKLIVKIAVEMHHNWSDCDIMDYIQEGNETLLDIVDKFNPKKQVKFSSFLSYCVKNRILAFIKRNTGAVSLTDSKGQRAVFANLQEIRQELERGGLTPEVIKRFGVTFSDVNVILNVNDSRPLEEQDIIDDGPEELYIKNESMERLRRKISDFRKTLNDQELVVFDDVLYNQTTSLVNVAQFYNVSRQYMWKVKESVIEKAKEFFTEEDLESITS